MFKTAVRKNNLRPVWNETFLMAVQDPSSQKVVLQVYDWNNIRPVRTYPELDSKPRIYALAYSTVCIRTGRAHRHGVRRPGRPADVPGRARTNRGQ